MRTLLAKFKISSALDDQPASGKPAPVRPDESPELRRTRESLLALDGRLKAARPAAAVPAGLHHSIMRTVRAGSRLPARGSWRFRLRWLPAPAVALLLLFVVLWSLLHPTVEPAPAPPLPEARPLAAAAAALTQGRAVAEEAPAAMLAPLSVEMDALKRDFNNALEFVMASLP